MDGADLPPVVVIAYPQVVTKFHIIVALLLTGLIGSSACSGAQETARSSGGKNAIIDTDKGPIEIAFYEAEQPRAVENFRLLAERGYYNNLTFHRIVKDFMIQGGDPNGDGSGGVSAWGGFFADEINPGLEIYQAGYRPGVVAYANAGPNTNGSQFFIVHGDAPLPPAYVIFAKVTRGMEVVDAIANVPTTLGADMAQSKPLTPPVIKTVTIRP